MVLAVLFIFRLNTIGQAKTDGTIIVVDASKNEIVIAADSRTSGTNTYSDDNCKISAFGDKIVFTASGRTGSRSGPTKFWDAHAIALREFERLTRKGAPDDLPINLAQAWGIAIKKKIEYRISQRVHVLAGLDDSLIMSAFFAGVRKDGSILAVIEKISYEVLKDGTPQIERSQPNILTSSQFPQFLGKGDIIKEFDAGQTLRADQWRHKLIPLIRASTDQVATEAIEEVRLTIDNLATAKFNAKGVPFSEVGYPIAAIRLTSKGAEWIERGNCPQK
jgi:hypothetical protein